MTSDFNEKFESDDPRCEKCNTSLDYCEEEGVNVWWQCPKCGNIEGEGSW